MTRAAVGCAACAMSIVVAGCWPAPPTPRARPAVPALCEAGAPERVGRVTAPELVETSGLVASRRHRDVLWAHNDSGDSPRLFALRRDGSPAGVFTIEGARALDWEDIAVGPAASGSASALYVGDIGDNARTRDEIEVYVVDEPASLDAPTLSATTLRFRYPDGAHDAEALLVDPLTGDLYVITKDPVRSRVFRAPAPLVPGPTTLTEVASVSLGGGLVTAADTSIDGTQVVVRTYGSVRIYRRRPDRPLTSAFRTRPCLPPPPTESQGESVAVELDGRGYVTVSEGSGAPVMVAR